MFDQREATRANALLNLSIQRAGRSILIAEPHSSFGQTGSASAEAGVTGAGAGTALEEGGDMTPSVLGVDADTDGAADVDAAAGTGEDAAAPLGESVAGGNVGAGSAGSVGGAGERADGAPGRSGTSEATRRRSWAKTAARALDIRAALGGDIPRSAPPSHNALLP